MLMSSCPELVYLLLTLNKLGAVANMINPLLLGEQIKKQINDMNAELLIVLDYLYDVVNGIKNSLCIKKTEVVPVAESMSVFNGLIAGIKLKRRYPTEIMSFHREPSWCITNNYMEGTTQE